MAHAFYFNPPSKMSAQQYDESIARLKAAGALHPPGRLYHACFGSADQLMVFDIWASQEAFEKFGETLMPILQAVGVTPAQPDVMPLHNTIVPPAPKPRNTKRTTTKAMKKKARPAKKSGTKKATKR